MSLINFMSFRKIQPDTPEVGGVTIFAATAADASAVVAEFGASVSCATLLDTIPTTIRTVPTARRVAFTGARLVGVFRIALVLV